MGEGGRRPDVSLAPVPVRGHTIVQWSPVIMSSLMLYTNKHHEYTSHVSLHHLFSATGYLLTVYWIEIEIPWHVCVLGTMYLSKRMMNCSLDTTTIVTASVAAV